MDEYTDSLCSPDESFTPKLKPRPFWTTRQIYDMITYRIGHAMHRYVAPDEIIGRMLYEAEFDETAVKIAKLTKQLRHIENAFKIKIYASYTMDDIASIAEWSLSKRGRMVDTPYDSTNTGNLMMENAVVKARDKNR